MTNEEATVWITIAIIVAVVGLVLALMIYVDTGDAKDDKKGFLATPTLVSINAQLQLNNAKLREALLIAKGLIDAMMFIKEEPHEGSYGWIINEALRMTEEK